MYKKLLCLTAGLVVLLGSAPVFAFDWFGGRLSLGGGYGRVKPKLPYSFQDTYQDGEMWTGNLKYFINRKWSVVASYADLQPYMRGNKQDVYRIRPIVGSVRYNMFHNLPFSPYLTAGAGYSINKHEIPNAATVKWEGFTYQGGFGLEFFINEGTSLGAEALYHHVEADGANHPYRFASAVGTINFYFGDGPTLRRTKDALEQERAEKERARAEAERTRAETLAAQQAAMKAQEGQNAAQEQANAAQQQATAAQQAAAAAQAQVSQAQAEVEQIKGMVASKQISPVMFKTGSAVLDAKSNATLDKVAEVAKKYPNLKLRVEGHTDSTGSAATNQALSQKRADAVRDYLTGTGGVNVSQISSVGFGPSQPIASNDTSDGRTQNRRVEFIFTLP